MGSTLGGYIFCTNDKMKVYAFLKSYTTYYGRWKTDRCYSFKTVTAMLGR